MPAKRFRPMFLPCLLACAMVGGGAPLAAAADAESATNTRTVFIDKGSAGSVVKALNKSHAKMEADGWTYVDMGVYTEDGDLEGIFVTYVRKAASP
jgi:hypothetical protein